jgi:hypothetical protein
VCAAVATPALPTARTLLRAEGVGLVTAHPIDNACLGDVGGVHFDAHQIARYDFDKVFSQFPRNASEDDMFVGQFYSEHSARQNLDYSTFEFDELFFWHVCA